MIEKQAQITPEFWVIIPAAGTGSRMQQPLPKQYLTIQQFPILCHTISQFLSHPKISGLVVVISKNDPFWPKITQKTNQRLINNSVLICEGGEQRTDSVLAGLKALQPLIRDDDFVMVHDAARPGVNKKIIDRVIAKSKPLSGVIVATAATDTIKQVSASGKVIKTLERATIWCAQTPQCYPFKLLLDGYLKTKKVLNRNQLTDESSVMESQGIETQVVEGSHSNFKVTQVGDLETCEHMIRQQLRMNQRVHPKLYFDADFETGVRET